MKKLTFTLLIALIAIAISSCKKDSTTNNNGSKATACFTISKSSPNIQEYINYNSCSTNAKSYKWEFGDGEESTDSLPEHYYTTAGSYTIKLTVYDVDGKTSSTTKTITVQNPATQYTGTWNLTETTKAVNGSDSTFTYQSVITAAADGSLTLTNFGRFHKTITANLNAYDGYEYWNIVSSVVNTTYNVTMQGNIFFNSTTSISTNYGQYNSPVLSGINVSFEINGSKL